MEVLRLENVYKNYGEVEGNNFKKTLDFFFGGGCNIITKKSMSLKNSFIFRCYNKETS